MWEFKKYKKLVNMTKKKQTYRQRELPVEREERQYDDGGVGDTNYWL